MHLRSFLPACLFVLMAMVLLLEDAQAGLHPVRPRRQLLVKKTMRPTGSTTQRPIIKQPISSRSIGPGGQFDPPAVHYETWAAWAGPADGAIPSCTYW